jgi:hypothetical protein
LLDGICFFQWFCFLSLSIFCLLPSSAKRQSGQQRAARAGLNIGFWGLPFELLAAAKHGRTPTKGGQSKARPHFFFGSRGTGPTCGMLLAC